MAISQIKTGAVLSYVVIGINLIIGLVYTPWMINSIGKENYGLYILATSVITLFMFDFGLGTSVTKFVSQFLAEGRQDKVNNFMGLVLKIYMAISVILFLILVSVYFFIPSIYQELTPEEIEKFKIVYAIAACFSVISFPFIPLDGIITAHEHFIQLKFCELFNKLFLVSTMAICLLAGYGLYALVTVNAIAGLLTILLKVYVIKRYTQLRPNMQYFEKGAFHEVVGYSWWVTVGILAQRLIFNIAPTILGMVSGSVEIALFGIASVFEAYVYTFASAWNSLFLPRVTQMTLNEDRESILSLMTKVGRIQIMIIGLIVIGFVSLGGEFVTLWLGQGYEKVYPTVVLLIIPSFFHLPQLIGGNAILAMNKVKQQAYVFVIMGVVNLILGYILAGIMGAMGYAISVFVAYMIRTIGLNVIYYRDLKLDIFRFFKDSFLKMAPALAVSCVAAYFIHLLHPGTWISWGAGVIGVTAAYFGIMYFLAMNKEERNTFLSPLKLMGAKIRRS